jgi:hypothetical protein
MRQGLRPVRPENSRRGSVNKRPAIAVLSLVIGVLAGVFAQPAIARKRPDLVIAHSEATGPRSIFRAEPSSVTFHFEDVTKNVGDATAGRSRTTYWLVPLHQGRGTVRYLLGSREVPRLRPGDTDRGRAREHIGSGLELGAYLLKVCADKRDPISGGRGAVRESSERNNCDSTGRRFYVIKRTWDGSLSGRGNIGSASGAERWHTGSGAAFLEYEKYLGDGVFLYRARAAVTWTDNGVNTIGCHFSGGSSGSVLVPEEDAGPGIKLRYGDAIYAGREILNTSYYTISQSGIDMFGDDCADNPPLNGPVNREYLQIKRKSLVFDQNELQGSIPGDTPLAFWRWDFE